MGNGLVNGSAWPNGNSQPTSSKKDPEASYRDKNDQGLSKGTILTPETKYSDNWESSERGNITAAKEQKSVTQKDGRVKNSAFTRYKY